jgi:hypothetical protein
MSIQQGEKIWSESLMTLQEWKERSKKYPSTSSQTNPPEMFDCEFKWRHNMGGSLSTTEIRLVSKRIDNLAEELRKINEAITEDNA